MGDDKIGDDDPGAQPHDIAPDTDVAEVLPLSNEEMERLKKPGRWVHLGNDLIYLS